MIKQSAIIPRFSIVLQPSTRFLHNDDTGVFGTSTENEGMTEAIRISQRNQVSNSTRLELVVTGASELEVGDMIEFDMPIMTPETCKSRRLSWRQ